MKIQGLLKTTLPRAHRRADNGWHIQRWSMRSALLLACIVSVASAHGGSIIGGSTLLDSAGLDLLEGWLGEGELDVTNIFTKETGDTSYDFHAAVDGMGRTFSLIEVVDSESNRLQVIGGYNPQSWSSIGDYNQTYSDAERTAFIFDLSVPAIQRQKPSTSVRGAWIGAAQTYNILSYGPTFGGGHDLYTDYWLTYGHSLRHSYGPDGNYGWGYGVNESIVGYSIGQIEVFTIASAAPAVVPIPAPAALGLLGMGLVAAVRRRKKLVQD